jgi:AcrR family transcriptional regulator
MAPMHAASTGVRGRRSRRRGAQLEHAILDAAWDELRAVGYGNLTMAAVARRAKTSKAVLYRRWPNRVELIAAAIDHCVPDLDPHAPKSDTLRGDILALLRHLTRRYAEVQHVPGHDAELAAYLRRRASASAAGQIDQVLRRAQERREIEPAQVTPRIAQLPLDLLRHQLFLTDVPVSADTLTEIVDEIFLPLVNLRKQPLPPAHPHRVGDSAGIAAANPQDEHRPGTERPAASPRSVARRDVP